MDLGVGYGVGLFVFGVRLGDVGDRWLWFWG